MTHSLNALAGRPARLMLATLLIAAAGAALPVFAQPAADQTADLASDHMRGDGPGGPGHHRGPGAGPMGGPGGPGGHGPMGGPMGLLHGRALDAVKATPEQRNQIRQIMEAAHKDLAGQRDARRALRDEGMKLFSQPTIDPAAAESLRLKRQALQDQASRRMTQAMVDAARVLTPEQRKQLGEQMQRRQQMMERHRQERDALEGGKR